MHQTRGGTEALHKYDHDHDHRWMRCSNNGNRGAGLFLSDADGNTWNNTFIVRLLLLVLELGASSCLRDVQQSSTSSDSWYVLRVTCTTPSTCHHLVAKCFPLQRRWTAGIMALLAADHACMTRWYAGSGQCGQNLWRRDFQIDQRW